MSKLQAANNYPDVTEGVDLFYYPGEQEDEFRLLEVPQSARERLLEALDEESGKAFHLMGLKNYTDQEIKDEYNSRFPF